MSALVLVGGGGHCRSVIDVLEAIGTPVAGIVCGKNCEYRSVLGYPALGYDDDLHALRSQYDSALVTVGQIKSPDVRKRLFTCLEELDFILSTYVSPMAHVSRHAVLGRGVVVMHHALVNACASVGDNCIVNTKALIEHDCVIERHCHIAVGAVLCGGVHVAEGSFVGAGAVVKQGVHIGAHCVIGMGARVLKDVPEGTVYV